MEMLFLNDNMKSYLRKNIQKKLRTNDWVCMVLGIFGTFAACIAVSLLFSTSIERNVLLERPKHWKGNLSWLIL